MPSETTNNASKTVDSLLSLFDDDRLQLPEIQRDFVWTRKSIELLLDSLYNGLPIGSMLVWKPKKPVATKPIHGRGKRQAGQSQERYGYLLDGQQRLTALLHLREQDDDYPLAFNVRPDCEAEGRKRFYWRSKNEKPDPWAIPLSDALGEGFNVAERLNRIRADPYFKPEHEEFVLDALTSLAAIRNYPVGIVEFETDDYRKATELFVRFNSTGRKLSRGDLSMAQLAINLPDLASDHVRPAGEKWKEMSFTAPYLVQCLLAVHTDRFQVKDPERFWPVEDAKQKQVMASWRETERAVDKLVAFLTGTVSWRSGREIPSFNALIPLVYILAKGARWNREDTLLARRWLLLACTRGYFSGSAQTSLDKVLKAVSGELTPARLWGFTKKELPRLNAEDFETGRLSGPAMSLYLSMLRNVHAKDLGPSLASLDGTVVGRGAALQVHHFFPRALLRKHKVRAAEVDTFANYAVISASTNLNAGTEEPATYLPRALREAGEDARKLRAELRKQCIPHDSELWRVANYRDFLAERRRLLAAAANRFLGL